MFDRLEQALLESIADEILLPGANVVAVYSAFEAGLIDSISFVRLEEHLGRLTARDLRQIETSVPLDTLKGVVDLALEIGREGREGKPVGTMFVVGDTKRVLTHAHPAGFDPVKGYSRKERYVHDPRARESIKEVAQLDGAFIVAPDGTVEKASQIVNAPYENLTLSKGLGCTPLGRRGHQQSDQRDCRRRERVHRHRAHLPERRSHPARRTAPPGDEMERLRLRAAVPAPGKRSPVSDPPLDGEYQGHISDQDQVKQHTLD